MESFQFVRDFLGRLFFELADKRSVCGSLNSFSSFSYMHPAVFLIIPACSVKFSGYIHLTWKSLIYFCSFLRFFGLIFPNAMIYSYCFLINSTSNYEEMVGGPDYGTYVPRDEERIGQTVIRDTESISASYDRYLRNGVMIAHCAFYIFLLYFCD